MAGCGACKTERKTRERLATPAFPVDSECRHPGAGEAPGFPVRYVGDRFCGECAMLVGVEVVVEDPGTVGYRCGQGHMWLARMAALDRVEATG